MNYLAHLLLSFDHPGERMGNFAGDLFKGNSWEQLPEDIGRGIRLHRFIDSHADNHPVNAEVREQLRPYFGRYAGVALDLYYDHLLACEWHQHEQRSIPDFLADCNADFEARGHDLPPRALRRWQMIYSMGWMHQYHTPEGIGKVFDGMKGRIRHRTGFEHSRQVLSRERDLLLHGFHHYFPQLQLAAREHLRKLAGH